MHLSQQEKKFTTATSGRQCLQVPLRNLSNDRAGSLLNTATRERGHRPWDPEAPGQLSPPAPPARAGALRRREGQTPRTVSIYLGRFLKEGAETGWTRPKAEGRTERRRGPSAAGLQGPRCPDTATFVYCESEMGLGLKEGVTRHLAGATARGPQRRYLSHARCASCGANGRAPHPRPLIPGATSHHHDSACAQAHGACGCRRNMSTLSSESGDCMYSVLQPGSSFIETRRALCPFPATRSKAGTADRRLRRGSVSKASQREARSSEERGGSKGGPAAPSARGISPPVHAWTRVKSL